MMKIRYLLKSQSNQVLEETRAALCEPAEFEWQDTTGHQSNTTISKLVHNPSGYYFTFDNHGNFYSQWSPAAQTFEASNGSNSWDSQLLWFRQWLNYLKRETESPDLWAENFKGNSCSRIGGIIRDIQCTFQRRGEGVHSQRFE